MHLMCVIKVKNRNEKNFIDKSKHAGSIKNIYLADRFISFYTKRK